MNKIPHAAEQQSPSTADSERPHQNCGPTENPSGHNYDPRRPKIRIMINLNQKASDAKNKWGVARGEGLE